MKRESESYLQPLDGEPQHAGRELGRLLEGEVAPVDDEDEAVDLQLWVLDHGLQRQQDGPQDVHEGVPEGRGTARLEEGGKQNWRLH